MKQKNTNQSLDKLFLNPTKVRIAFECPRLFYLYQHFGGKNLFIVPNGLSGVGQLFHQLCEQCFKISKTSPQLIQLLSSSIILADLNSQLQQLLYKQVFYFYLEKYPNLAIILPQIWQGLTQLIYYWSELLLINKAYFSGQELIQKTLVEQEYELKCKFKLPDGTTQNILGKCDSLVFNRSQNRLIVVEYKTHEAVDPSSQLAQVALYSYMVNQQKQLPVDAVVYCILPKFKKYEYSWEQLQDTLHQILAYKLQQMREWIVWQEGNSNPPPPTTYPNLCHICPQKEKCQSFFNRG